MTNVRFFFFFCNWKKKRKKKKTTLYSKCNRWCQRTKTKSPQFSACSGQLACSTPETAPASVQAHIGTEADIQYFMLKGMDSVSLEVAGACKWPKHFWFLLGEPNHSPSAPGCKRKQCHKAPSSSLHTAALAALSERGTKPWSHGKSHFCFTGTQAICLRVSAGNGKAPLSQAPFTIPCWRSNLAQISRSLHFLQS